MNIQFKRIQIENFMSIGTADLHLDNLGFTLVSGVNNNPDDFARSNGSGKSSILEAIVWCLTGDTMRGNKSIVNNYGNDGAMVLLSFDINQDSYILMRTKDHSIHKTTLKICVNNEDRSGKGIRDSEKLLSSYLPDLTASLIGSVIVLGQGLPTRFTNNTPSGRKEVLEKLCKTDFMIQDLKDGITARKAALSDQLRDIEDRLLQTRTRVEGIESNISVANNAIEKLLQPVDYDKLIGDLSSTIQSVEQELNTTENQLNNLLANKDKIEDVLTEKSSQSTSILSELATQWVPIVNDNQLALMTVTNQLHSAEAEYHRLSSVKDVCPTCGQKLQGVEIVDLTDLIQRIEELKKQVFQATSTLKQSQHEYQNAQDDATSKLQTEMEATRAILKEISAECTTLIQKEKSLRNNLNDQLLAKSKIEDERSLHQTKLKEARESLAQYDKLKEAYNKDILYFITEKDNLEVHLGVINKFNTIVTRDFRGYLLSNVIAFIDQTAKRFSKRIFETELIDFKLDGNNISISYNGKEYEALSGGERQKVDLIVQFSIREMLCKHLGFSTNIIALDEIFDNLDDIGCSKVIDLISNDLEDVSSIFIITHHGAELSIPCDNEIIVVKEADGVSHIQ